MGRPSPTTPMLAWILTTAAALLVGFLPPASVYAATPAPSTSSPFTVDLISATTAPAAGGTTMTLTGTGFSEPVTVRFGDVSATNVSAVERSPSVYMGATDGRGTRHFQEIAGRPVSVMNHFSRWAGSSLADPLGFPAEWVEALHNRGVIPMITWNPTFRDPKNCKQFRSLCRIDLAKIADGDFDSYLKKYANEVKKSGIPIFLRTMHEANGDWYPWNVQKPGSAAEYIAAWRHIHDVFAAVGATNVTWVWCPNIRQATTSTSSVSFQSFYPGDDYVDWVALDGYNRGADRSFDELFGSSLRELGTLTRKPVMIAEIGSATFSSPAARGDFLKSTFAQDLPQNYPQIRAILYFMNSQDVDLSKDSRAAQAFASGVAGDYYAESGIVNVIDGKIVPLRQEDAITVTVPPHPAGSVTITVSRGDGDTAVAAQLFEYVDPLGWVPNVIGIGAVIAIVISVIAWLIFRRARRRRPRTTASPPTAH